jgi:hypothetical protein
MRSERQIASREVAASVRSPRRWPLRARRARIIEAVTFGLAFSSCLCWVGVCLVAIFRQAQLARPYWPAVSSVRTDTAGAIAFLISGAGLAVSEYFRLDRGSVLSWPTSARRRFGSLAAQATAETTAVLSSALIIYLSANQVTHPVTIELQATHFASWPTEGTLRVLSLLACAVSTGAARWLRADRVGYVACEGR